MEGRRTVGTERGDMRRAHLEHLVCPTCKINLTLRVDSQQGDRIETGELSCGACSAHFPIVGFVPRFAAMGDGNYANAFGFQWNRHYRTQYDGYTGAPISEERFFKETRWPRRLDGEVILEAGSGSGRFTEHAAATGATVISFDYSHAVEANYRNNGHLPNLLIVQASIYEMPFRPAYFNRVVCIGVVQHTPDPRRSFDCLAEMLRPAGQLVVDAYRRFAWWKQLLITKYWVRPFTRRLSPPALYRFCERWVDVWWKPTDLARRLSGSRGLSWMLLVPDYRGVYALPDDVQREWAVLDMFDMLSPAYDFPQTLDSVRSWFAGAGLTDVDIGYGFNGIEGRGSRP